MHSVLNQMKYTGIVFALMFGCRTNLRPQTNASDPVSIEVRMVGLKDIDKSRTELVYTLSSCGLSPVTGSKNADDIVQFNAPMVAKNDICKVRVNSSKDDSNAVKWFDDQGLMYEAQNVTIRSDSGKLEATAYLQQMYTSSPSTTPNKIFKINAGVRLPDDAVSTCTCSISCSPALANNVAELETGADKKIGACNFANLTNKDLAATECSKLKVQCGDKLYAGEWKPASKFDGSQSKEITLPDLTLTQGVISDISEATIEIVVPTKK